jgi:hypothetical protein
MRLVPGAVAAANVKGQVFEVGVQLSHVICISDVYGPAYAETNNR